jgi:hypothetical protein
MKIENIEWTNPHTGKKYELDFVKDKGTSRLLWVDECEN